MNNEKELNVPNSEIFATVVGGNGAIGMQIKTSLKSIGFRDVETCEIEDSLSSFVKQSKVIFFAIDDKETAKELKAIDSELTEGHIVLDSSSVKEDLIPIFKELDSRGISVASTHLGINPLQPWRGAKVWICEVGPNSERAVRLARDIFISNNSSISIIDIEDHKNVEMDQWMTHFIAQIGASALIEAQFPLSRFDTFATLSAELLALLIGRILGQGTGVPSEILFRQPRRMEFLNMFKKAFAQLEEALKSEEALQGWIGENFDIHNKDGAVDALFKKAGIGGARQANLRMHKMSFRTTIDRPGALRMFLEPFDIESANLTAIDSMPGTITEEERKRGINPDGIVDFDIGIDPKTIDEGKEKRIKERLIELGCTVS